MSKIRHVLLHVNNRFFDRGHQPTGVSRASMDMSRPKSRIVFDLIHQILGVVQPGIDRPDVSLDVAERIVVVGDVAQVVGGGSQRLHVLNQVDELRRVLEVPEFLGQAIGQPDDPSSLVFDMSVFVSTDISRQQPRVDGRHQSDDAHLKSFHGFPFPRGGLDLEDACLRLLVMLSTQPPCQSVPNRSRTSILGTPGDRPETGTGTVSAPFFPEKWKVFVEDRPSATDSVPAVRNGAP